MEWIKIVNRDDKPNYYKGVIIFADGKIYCDWHRLSDGDSEFYGSLKTDLIIDGDKVTHWILMPENPKINKEWIKVEDRVPNEGEPVLVFFDYGDKTTIEIDEVGVSDFITHWMPLPETPINKN